MKSASSLRARPRHSFAGRLRIVYRCTLLFLLLGAGIIFTPTMPLFRRFGVTENRVAGVWFRVLLAIIGVQAQIKGKPAGETVMVVANHISWVDIPALSAFSKTLFVSKSEVRDWPLIGWFASEIGTVFLPRGAHQTREAIGSIKERIDDGQPVAIFPEGTTTGQRIPRPFHARLFAVALESNIPIQPVALRYLPPAGVNSEQHPAAPYIDNIAFGEHLFRLLATPNVTLEIIYCPVIHGEGKDRRALAHAAWQMVCNALGGAPEVMTPATPEQSGRPEQILIS